MTDFVNPFGGVTVPPSESRFIEHTITEDSLLYWPNQYDGETGLMAASIMEFVTDPNLTVTLPPANQMSTGYDLLVRNTGANSFDVVDFDGGAVATINPGESRYVYVADNTTAAGLWSLFTYGTGTSAADASLLAGNGLQANAGKIRVNASYRSVSGTTSLTLNDRGKLVEAVSGSGVVTLPQASSAGDGYYAFLHNSAAGSITLSGHGSETVDGSLSKTLFPGESCIVICNGTYWLTVGYGKDVEFTFGEFVVDMAAGDQVLTSDQVAGRMIRLSGTASGDVEITLPTVDNIYFLNVESGIGEFTATFTTGGGTTVVLTADQKTAVYCDGTNVTAAVTTTVTATTALADGSAATPSLGFDLDADTGVYRIGTDALGISAGGTQVAQFDAAGLTGTVVFTPVGDLTATTVAGALAELDSDLTVALGLIGTNTGNISTNTGNISANSSAIASHLSDPTAAHEASAVSVVPTGNVSSTDGQAAIAELDTFISANSSAISNHLADATDAHDASAVSVAPTGGLSATDVQAALVELDNEKVTKTADTGSAVMPSGTGAQRDGSPTAGYLRFNSDLNSFEGYNGSDWGNIGGGASGGGANSVFYENDTNVTTDYTITSGKNAMSAGPITVDSGVTVTVPTGSTWTIV